MDKEKLLENFILNRLSEQEAKVFEHLYNSDSEFKKDVDFELTLESAIKNNEDDRLKADLQAIESNLKIKRPLRIYWYAAAILITALGVFWVLNFNDTNNEDLFASYYSTPPNITFPLVRGEDSESLTRTAYVLYEQNKFKEASFSFQKAYDVTKDSKLLFYLGVSHLNSADTEKAIENLSLHRSLGDELMGRSTWFLALAYLKAGDTQKAKNLLQQHLNSSEEFKAEKAEELLKKLE